ncbi:MAG: hypothetical protein ACO1OK_05765 [Devosia sp.]
MPIFDRAGVALVSGVLVAVSALFGLILVLAMGPGLVSLLITVVLMTLAVGVSLIVGRVADRAFSARIAALRGLPQELEHAFVGREGESVEAILAALLQRLDRAGQIRTAFSALSHPAVLVGPSGIMAATRGLEQSVQGGAAALDLEVLVGHEPLVALGTRRFRLRRSSVGAGRILVELLPAGHFIAEDDYELFVAALSGEAAGARFSPSSVSGSPVIAAMQESLERLDAVIAALDRMAAGIFDGIAGRDLPPGTQALLERIAMLMAEMGEARDEAEASNTSLEQRVLALEASVTTLQGAMVAISDHAAMGRTGVEKVNGALARARNALEHWEKLEGEAIITASDAQMASRGASPEKVEALLDEISAHLENLGNESRKLRAVLGEGATALGTLGEVVDGIGAETDKGLERKSRRRVA